MNMFIQNELIKILPWILLFLIALLLILYIYYDRQFKKRILSC